MDRRTKNQDMMNRTDVIMKKKSNDFLETTLREEAPILSAIVIVLKITISALHSPIWHNHKPWLTLQCLKRNCTNYKDNEEGYDHTQTIQHEPPQMKSF